MSPDLSDLPATDPDEHWDLVVSPSTGILDLHLSDLWRYRDLVLLFVKRDFVSQFKQTVLGPVWFVLQPLITTIVFTIVFGNIAKLSTDGLPKVVFYLSGNILWMYFQTCLISTADTFVKNAHIFGKVYFPRLSVPLSITLSQLLRFGVQFVFFQGFVVYYIFSGAPITFTWHALLAPVCVLIMAGMALGLGILISALTTKYRDLRFLLEFGIRLAMYGTTVIYPLSSLEDSKWRGFVLANPMTPLIEAFRLGFLGKGVFSWGGLCYSAAFGLVSLLVGIILFNRIERTFMDTV